MAMGEEWLLDGHLNLGQSIVRSSSAAHVITQFIMLEALWRPSGKARRSFGESEMAAIPAKETTKTWGPLQHSHHLHLKAGLSGCSWLGRWCSLRYSAAGEGTIQICG
jgi:hypothetical protein